MEQQSRRGLLKNAAKAAAVATGGIVLGKTAEAQASASLKKSRTQPSPNQTQPLLRRHCFQAPSRMAICSSSPVSARTSRAPSREHTKHVLDELEKNLIGARFLHGESPQGQRLPERHQRLGEDEHRVRGPLGKHPSVRTTIAPAGGIPAIRL